MSTARDQSAALVERGDLDELTRHVDRLVAAGDWDALVDLGARCRAALERGKQLWPVSAHVEYRLALEAPGEWAAAVLQQGTGRFALGPLPEVAASRHRWEELAPHIPRGPVGGLAAHERVVHGEDLTGDDRVDGSALELPLVLQEWEPLYPVAEYKPDEASFPTPSVPKLRAVDLPRALPEEVGDPDSCRSLVELPAAWTTESNGRAEAMCVAGGALDALRAIGLTRARVAEIDGATALAHLAWAAASGGAHGRRRGMAAGRFGAWWVLAALAGVQAEWPVHPDVLGEAAERLNWVLWDAAEPSTGWGLHLAVADGDEGLAWAVSATDTA